MLETIRERSVLHAALDQVAEKDPDVRTALELVGYPEPRIADGGFPALLSIVVNQQISKEAARAILGRLEDLLPVVEATAFAQQSDDALKQAGLSRPKIKYVRGIAEAITSGRLEIDRFPELSDVEVIDQLTALNGIGRWSAEIYCMFSLGRPDLFPGEDIALQEGIRRLKKLPERPKPKAARSLAEQWSPWQSAMAVFLWHYYRGAPATDGQD